MSSNDTPFVSNDEIARVLFHVASLLSIFGENRFRVRAYRRAALGVLLLPRPLAEYVFEGSKLPIPGVGQRLSNHLRELVNTGHFGVYDELLEDLGEPLTSLLTVPGVGPKTAIRLMRELKIDSIQALAAAARDGQIRSLRGFGLRSEARLGHEAEHLLEIQAA
ncbi:MAG TPA: helix-hairpin-helix domain-containing protein [Chloroflexota bacterium]